MRKTAEKDCPYGCGRIVPEGAGRHTCGQQPCVGMAISMGLQDYHKLKRVFGGTLTVADRIETASEREMAPTGQCVIWYGTIMAPDGYPQMGHEGKHISVARAALEIYLGRPIKDGMQALRREECNEPRCVGRECLYEGTPSERTLSSVKRGTHRWSDRRLTPEVLDRIRHLGYVDQLTNKDIAQKEGTSAGTVSKILWRQIYSDRPLNDEEREALKRRKAKRYRSDVE